MVPPSPVFWMLIFALFRPEPIKIVGPTTIKPNSLVRLEVSGVAETASVRWSIPPGLDAERNGRKLVATGPAGTYRIVALVIDFDAKAFDELSVTVTIESPPLPAPVPPAPVPPAPGGKPTPAAALCRLRVGSSGCTATIVGPRRPDGKWDVLTAAHCWGVGIRGQITTQAGRTLAVTRVETDKSSDIAWMVTDDATLADLPYAMLATALPPSGTSVWHAGYGVDRPGNREEGTVAGVSGGQLSFVLNVSSGDSGGGIFRADTGELLACVCCTRSIGRKTTMWGGHCIRAAQLRPKPAMQYPLIHYTDDGPGDGVWYHPVLTLDP